MAYMPKRGDIIIMDFDPQAGYEQKGRRPALVVSNETYNRHCKMALVCPITHTNKAHAFHVPLPPGMQTSGVVLCDQVRAQDITARRAQYKEAIPEDILSEVVDIISAFLD